MDNIIEPNDKFNFLQLTLAHPSGIQGGAYFTKIENNKKPLYIETPKSLTRQGFIKSGKKYYCDLMFDKNSEQLIHWFENLEERCKKLIYEKREAWFQNSLEENDIETAFNSVIRVYKSGKYYLVRTNVKTNKNDEPVIKIYSETESQLTINDVNQDTNIISILEIQGIKFTSRNFQIEIELKQVMVLDSEPIFDNCLIKSFKKKSGEGGDNEPIKGLVPTMVLDEITQVQPHVGETVIEENKSKIVEVNEDTLLKESQDGSIFTIEAEDLNEDLINKENSNKEDLKEVNINFSLEQSKETIKLKKPNQVYFELYKQARRKAKEAKKNAIIAYLEAKNIKKTYLIENLNDSDSEFDAEIDEVSESELDQFDI
jgi:hypothetical protein